MPNAELAYRVLDHIDAHPESWDQETWYCETSACFAGWAALLSGLELGYEDGRMWDVEVVSASDPLRSRMVGWHVQEAACALLGISHDHVVRIDGEDDELFNENNDRAKLGELVKEIFGPRPDGMDS